MTFTPQTGFDNFLPEDIILPEDDKEKNLVLTDYFKNMVPLLNAKEIGIYNDLEILNGETWFNTANRQNRRNGYRTVVDFGVLPNATVKSVAHNITVASTTSFTHIYATATDPTAVFPAIFSVSIPYVNVATPGDDIEINVDDTNVNIRTSTANWTGFTTCYVVLEYLLD